jgi:hypothetical protein
MVTSLTSSETGAGCWLAGATAADAGAGGGAVVTWALAETASAEVASRKARRFNFNMRFYSPGDFADDLSRAGGTRNALHLNKRRFSTDGGCFAPLPIHAPYSLC